MERIEKLLSYLEQSPKDYFLRHALALEYIKIGEVLKASQLFENILAENPAYIGSYYHLAKLLESMNETKAAISCYKKGMQAADKSGDLHSFNELKSAYQELTMD